MERVGAAYVRSVFSYLEMLGRYVAVRIAVDGLVIILGDHQPSAEVTGDDPSTDVPIHVISRDRSVVGRFLAAGYAPGRRPAVGARRSTPMELFLPQLLQMFSEPPALTTRRTRSP